MKDIFELQNPSYNLRSSCNQFRRKNIKTGHYGLQSVRCLDPKIRELVPNNIKYSNSLSKFKKLIKLWKPESCSCRLCETYIAQVGFIWLSHNIQIFYQSRVMCNINFRVNFAQKLFLKPLFFYFNCYCISFCRLALFRHTRNSCELLCNFIITYLIWNKLI